MTPEPNVLGRGEIGNFPPLSYFWGLMKITGRDLIIEIFSVLLEKQDSSFRFEQKISPLSKYPNIVE